MKYYLIAGEASGDMHAANLMKQLQQKDNNAVFRYFGGEKMEAVGGTLVKHYKHMAFMGFLTVLMNIRTIKRNFKQCEEDLLNFKPDVLILVDYPGFNLRMAKFAKAHGIKVYYYISPKIWAWKESRIKKIKAYVDEMFTILPFETEFFQKHNFKVNYVGNPSVDALEKYKTPETTKSEFCKENHLDERPIIALLAGSRKQEIVHNLPEMVKMEKHYPDHQFVLAGAPSLEKEIYTEYLGNSNVKIVFGKTYEILQHAEAALVTSGTATLETAILDVPQIVVYKFAGGRIFFELLKKIVKVRLVSLVNLIVGRMIVKELLQHMANEKDMKAELDRILFDQEYRNEMLANYDEMDRRLGGVGAAEKAASKMVELLSV
ncbi:lipid-A-disaccharide synthase [Prolixibacteraceae bacterium JC049]|nr:lipid-A-disaccharide synthase [Prolixibacteraceae bacterium JC049]